jgi:hypothetical protein
MLYHHRLLSEIDPIRAYQHAVDHSLLHLHLPLPLPLPACADPPCCLVSFITQDGGVSPSNSPKASKAAKASNRWSSSSDNHGPSGSSSDRLAEEVRRLGEEQSLTSTRLEGVRAPFPFPFPFPAPFLFPVPSFRFFDVGLHVRESGRTLVSVRCFVTVFGRRWRHPWQEYWS